MLKLISRRVLMNIGLLCVLGLVGCSGQLSHYVDAIAGYGFDYPVGWQAIEVREATPGVVGVWRDPIAPTANISVIINPVPETTAHITDLGTPTEVGYCFFKEQTARLQAAQSGLLLEFLGADAYDRGIETYYTLEYGVTYPDGQERHNLASAVVHRGQLFTLNVGLPEQFWQRSIPQWHAIATSFEVF